MFTFGSLFSGIGCADYGIEEARGKSLFTVESCPKAAWTSKTMFGHSGDPKDVTKQNFHDYPEVDLLWASPECKRYSSSGSKNPDERDSNFADAIYRAAIKVNSFYLVVENVPEYYKSGEFQKLNYQLSKVYRYYEPLMLNAIDFGSPSARKRLFAIYGKEKIKLPDTSIRKYWGSILPNHTMTLSERTPYQLELLPIGRSWLAKRSGYYAKRIPCALEDQVVWTLKANDGADSKCSSRNPITYWNHKEQQAYNLGVAEYAMLLGFPRLDWSQCHRGAAFRGIGNGVSPLVSRAIAKALFS